MIDTHSHIYDKEFDGDRDNVVANAEIAGITQIILANEDSNSIERLYETHRQYADFTHMAMGLHPSSVTKDYKKELKIIEAELNNVAFCAIGEIGLDFYWDTTYKEEQIEVFEKQLGWAIDLDLPVIIHARKAYAEALASIAKFNHRHLRGVMHCFGGGIEEAKKSIEYGFYLGIGGVLTFKNSRLPELILQMGTERLLLETDAPYLSPVPYRGRRNEPKFMVETARKMASVFNTSLEKIDEITTKNAKDLFSL